MWLRDNYIKSSQTTNGDYWQMIDNLQNMDVDGVK